MRGTFAVLCMLAVIAGCAAQPAPSAQLEAARRASFQRDLSAFIDRIRGDANAPPGFVVVATDSEGTLFEGAYGMRNLATGAPMTLDTPIYNASVTKAYTGLLAAILDEQGILPLAATLRDVWPDLALPAPLDAAAIDARHLLSHTSRIDAGGLIFRSVSTGDISAADVPQHLSRYARAGPQAFVYANTGPFIYSAMVEARTGEAWSSALERHVLAPIGLSRTIARLEALPSDDIAHCHGRLGGAWRTVPHKPTATMNAAGGMYASGRDSARFLRAFLSEGASVGGRISAAALRETWTPAARQDRALWGMRRDGYGLGWDLGNFEGHRFVSRSGGYSGCRAIILFLPDDDFELAILSVGDAAVNTFNAAILGQAVDLRTGTPDAEVRADARIAEYAHTAAAEMTRIEAAEADIPPPAAIDASYARAVVGVYKHERLGRITVAAEGNGLFVTGGVFRGDLLRVDGDRFLILSRAEVDSQTFNFQRAQSGEVSGFLWDDDLYVRVH
jgi:CubicO group peptidase (beta-lactamase class C family)